MEKKGFIKVRRISKSSLGITLPNDLVKFLELDIGSYIYSAKKDKDNIKLNLKILEKVEE